MYPIKSDKVSITSFYGNRTYTYQGKQVKDFHRGIDLIANPNNRNEEIVAFEDGVVTSLRKKGKQYGDGCYVRIKHKNGLYTLYYHLKSNSICVEVGQEVKKGEVLGIIGTTGVSTGVHLHFQIDKGNNSSSINPYDYLFKDKKLIEESQVNKKSIEEIAKDVIKGDFGNYPERKKLLEEAGYIYSEVQSKVNEILSEEKTDTWIPKIGDKVKVIKTGKATSYGEYNTAKANYTGVITNDLTHKNRKYPYLVSVNKVCIGWYQKDALKKL